MYDAENVFPTFLSFLVVFDPVFLILQFKACFLVANEGIQNILDEFKF